MISSRTVRLSLAWGSLAIVLAGCTTAPAPSSAPSTAPIVPSTTDASAATATPATTGPSVTLGAPAPAPSDANTNTPAASPTSAPSTPSLISALPGSTVQLTLGSAFNATAWHAGDYRPAATGTAAPAFAATANCGQPGAEVEYRLAPTGGNITVSVAQDLLSPSSDNTVTFQLVADGRVVTEKAVSFKQAADLTAPLNGVTVVKIVATAKAPCRSSSTALITKAIIQG